MDWIWLVEGPDRTTLAFVLDLLGFRTVFECVQSLLIKFVERRDAGDHDGLGVASQRVFEYSG